MKLSEYCAEHFNISKRKAKNTIKSGLISIDKSIITKDIDIIGNENIIFNTQITPIYYNLDDYLLYKDDNYIFLYKPAFMHSERLYINDKLTISDVYKNFPAYKPLSRLDYEADGIIGMINKNIDIYNISKSYYAFVSGNFPKYIEISNKIDAKNNKKVKVLPDTSGFPAVMKNIKYNGKISIVDVTLQKATRHQVRAFSAYLSYPIIGDKIYNGLFYNRLCLHCYKYTINDKSFHCEKQTQLFLNLFNNI